MIQKPKLILIDLDGTLVDSVLDIAHAVDAMMGELDLPLRGEAKVRHWVGNGIERMVKRALTDELHAEPDASLYDKAYPVFLRHYTEANGKYSQLYPGVVEGLDAMLAQDFALGCVTNKAESFTLPLLKMQGVLDKFSLVVSGDTLPQKKPSPEPLLHAAKHFNVSPADSLMVGDSRHDVEAARAAGFTMVAVTYGYNHGDDIRLAKPDVTIDSLAQLTSLW